MTTVFSRSLRAIEGDTGRLGRWLTLPALVLLAVWGLWLARAEVPLYAASTHARLVRERAVHPLQSTVEGRVLSVHVVLDQTVEEGQLLLELDPAAQELALVEARARAEALEGESESTRASLAALEAARAEAHEATEAARQEALLELESRRLSLGYAREEAQRLSQLETTGDVSKLAASRARTDAERAEVAVRAQEAVLARLTQDTRRDDGDRAAEIAARRNDLAELDGQRAVQRAGLERLAHELELRQVRAPASGRVAELAALSPGTFVRSGESLGSIVAETRLAVEADFEPAEALGKVRLGQHGELALSGFPRAQFGALGVQVERIASEARDGRIRVELALLAPERARTPVEHGLPGEVRIEVERTSPLSLLRRAVGGSLGTWRTGDKDEGKTGTAGAARDG